ncbi:MAG TPA: hypothetical protein DEB24_02090 [Coriobacteriia bacterium]|nr:hypothetical protein [Coriobacteriia bacterium]
MNAISTAGIDNPEHNEMKAAYLNLLTWLSVGVWDDEGDIPAHPTEQKGRAGSATPDHTGA